MTPSGILYACSSRAVPRMRDPYADSAISNPAKEFGMSVTASARCLSQKKKARTDNNLFPLSVPN